MTSNPAPENFGVVIDTLDVNSMTTEDWHILDNALFRHQVVTIKNQANVIPATLAKLCARYDSGRPVVRGDSKRTRIHVWRDLANNPWEIEKSREGSIGDFMIPGVPEVLVIGQGALDNHHGITGTLGGKRKNYGFSAANSQVVGGGRFQWHIDGAFYQTLPPRVSAMHCIEAPQSRAVTATEDGRTYHYSKGATLFASGYLAYDKLDTDQRQLARSLLVNYGVHPFKRVHGLPMSRLGLRVINDDQDYTRHYEQAKEDTGCMRHPLVWKHPVTGRLALMGHTRCMLSMESIHGEWFDVEASRALLEDMYSRAVRPEFVHAVNHESGDLTLWDNFSVWHTATGGLEPEDRRVCHLCALNGSLEPEGAQ